MSRLVNNGSESFEDDNHIIESRGASEYQPDEFDEPWPPLSAIIKRNLKRAYAERQIILYNRLPILKWLPIYRAHYLFNDFVAGLTVGLTAIPQGIAYAVVAGLQPQYGLYSSFVGCFVYFFLGSSKDVTIGPTAIIALLIQRYVRDNPEFAVFIAFVNGALIFLFGMLNLGFLVQFISIPVTVGFTSAAALTIGSSQIKSLLGLKGSTNEFIPTWINLWNHVSETRLWDTLLGVSTICLLLLLKRLKYKRKFNASESPELSLWRNEFKKYLCLGRNALAVMIGTALAFCFSLYDLQPFTLTGEVTSGLPDFKIPPFHTTIGNTTLELPDMIQHLGSSVIAIPLISILESIAVAKAFSKGKTIDATQEMLALGLCNLFGSFFSSMPVTGSFTRTAVNNASGVRTTLGGIFTGTLVLLSLGFLTGSFRFIPKSTLAAVIICAMLFMVDREEVKEIWRARRIDVIPFLATLLSCLTISLEFGIIIGIMVNVAFILYTTARPEIHICNKKILDHDVIILMPDQSLKFSSADYFKYKVLKYVMASSSNIVIINGQFVQDIDSTVAKSICTVVEDLHLLNKVVYFWNWKKETANVVRRLNPKMILLFRNAYTEEQLLKQLCIDKGNSANSRISLRDDGSEVIAVIT